MARARRLWVPLDVNFFEDPKVLRVLEHEHGNAAVLLFVHMLTLSRRLDSGGVLTWPQLDLFPTVESVPELVDVLVEHKLVKVVGRSPDPRKRHVTVTGWSKWNEVDDALASRQRHDRIRQQRRRDRQKGQQTQGSASRDVTQESREEKSNNASRDNGSGGLSDAARAEWERDRSDPETRARVDSVLHDLKANLTGDADTGGTSSTAPVADEGSVDDGGVS